MEFSSADDFYHTKFFFFLTSEKCVCVWFYLIEILAIKNKNA